MSGQSGGGPGPPNLQISSPTPSPDQVSLTFAEAAGGVLGGTSHLKKYSEIIAQQKIQRNVIELKLRTSWG